MSKRCRRWYGRHLGLILWLLAVSFGVQANTLYVDGPRAVDLHDGPGVQHHVKSQLSAGTPVETGAKARHGWIKVHSKGGDTGYVQRRFLVAEQPDPDDNADKAGDESRGRGLDSAAAELRELDHDELLARSQKLQRQLQTLRETSADVERISRENEKYRGQLMNLQARLGSLKHENQSLQARHDGMKIGALIMFGGILLGFVLAIILRSSSSSHDSF